MQKEVALNYKMSFSTNEMRPDNVCRVIGPIEDWGIEEKIGERVISCSQGFVIGLGPLFCGPKSSADRYRTVFQYNRQSAFVSNENRLYSHVFGLYRFQSFHCVP